MERRSGASVVLGVVGAGAGALLAGTSSGMPVIPSSSRVGAGTIRSRQWFLDENGLSRGYLLEGDDTLVIDYPGAFTSDVGRVNNHGQANGIHFTPPFSISSFLLNQQGEFTDFSFPGMDITLIRGINELGDQCGAAAPDIMSPPQGFVACRGQGR